MRLDATVLRYLDHTEWRVLQAVEIGMKNHELVPAPLIAQVANLRRTGLHTVLGNLLKHKLVAHDGKAYDGYKLTYLGYDFLALRPLTMKGYVSAIGRRIGVGKESDIHICLGPDGDSRPVVVKFHRLGRVSFRSIKRNRDYLGNRQSASWMYLARLAAAKEFAYMKALWEKGFPVPQPIALNRHAVVMSFVEGSPLFRLRTLRSPEDILEQLMSLVCRMAEVGVIHGDFNEFNLIITENQEKVTVIDFPQIVSVFHPNAKWYFERDVECIRSLFRTRFSMEVSEYPKFDELRLPPQCAAKVGCDKDDALLTAAAEEEEEQQLCGEQQWLSDGGSEEPEDRQRLSPPVTTNDKEPDYSSGRHDKDDYDRATLSCDQTTKSSGGQSVQRDATADIAGIQAGDSTSSAGEVCISDHRGDSSTSEGNSESEDGVPPGRRIDDVWRPSVKRKSRDEVRKRATKDSRKKRAAPSWRKMGKKRQPLEVRY